MKRSTFLATILVTGLVGTAAFAASDTAEDLVQPLTCEDIISAIEESAYEENMSNFIAALETFAEQSCDPYALIAASPDPDASRHELCSNILRDAATMPRMLASGLMSQEEFDESAAAFQASADALQCGKALLAE